MIENKPFSVDKYLVYCAWAISLVYLTFGLPKLIDHVSPAEGLISYYFRDFSLYFNLRPLYFSKLIGLVEVFLAFGILFKRKIFAKLIIGHMVGTFLTFVFAWDKLFTQRFLTLEGQYILKNVFILLICYYLIANTSSKSMTTKS